MPGISFLNGGGEMGARMRQHDWLACSLGSPGTWSQALRTMVRLLLNTRHPMYIFWGPDGACLYNDAYCQSIGSERHPTSLGRPAREVRGEIWDVIGPQIDQVMGGGGGTWHENQLVPITRHGRREDVYWTYSYSPIDDETAPNGIGGVLVICNETTDAVQAQRLQTFWIKLNGAIHERSEPYEIMAAAASVLGSHLHAGRCGYGEVDERGLFFTVKRDWTDGAMASLAGRLRLADFGPKLVDELKADRTVRLDDPLTDMRTAGCTPAYASIGALRAGIAVPLRRDGRFVAAFYVHQTAPREWTDEEETLVREVAEYTWAAVERARAEDALRRLNATLEQHVAERTAQVQVSEARLRTIFETSYQYQGLLTPEGILVEANAISLQGIDSTLEDVVGQPFWETPWFTATPGMAETVRSAIPVVAGGETVRLEAHVNLPVGGWRWFDITMRPISDASGAVTAIVPEAVELTQHRHAEEALRQAQKMEAIGQLTGGIAHDFNNMLTGVIGSLDLIQRRLDAGNTCGLDRYLNAASASAQRAAGLTHRLLAFARQQSLDSKPQDVNALIISLTELLRRTLGESVALETVSRPDLWPALTDANQLESALVNLAINARDAMPDGGKLTITTSITRFEEAYALLDQEVQAGDYVAISVSDTGMGMPADVIEKAFDPFFTTKPIGQGTGLGLSMIYGFVKQSGGHVRIDSKIGIGTTVTLYLRRAPPVAEEPSAQTNTGAPRGRGETVLVVEDDPSVRLLITEVLGELGYRYIEAPDARTAIPHLQSGQTIDLLVTDVGLPNMNGRQLAEVARQHRPQLKVLFITGYAEKATVRGDFLSPGTEIMIKPFALDALGGKIRELIGG